jgi:peptidoglycan hydrolase-like amidase
MTVRRALAAVTVVGALVVVAPGSGVAAAAPGDLVATGHGFGHGRGMSQWGAFGYAQGYGTGTPWTSAQILDHFYGNTDPGAIASNTNIGVRLAARDSLPVRVQVADVQLATIGTGSPVLAPGKAIEITAPAPGKLRIADGSSCTSSFTTRTTVDADQLRILPAVSTADVFAFGQSGDVAVTGDWNGDGVDTIGVRRGNTWFLRNSNSAGPPHLSFSFGHPTDVPVVGDWNGNGVDTIGVKRGNQWYLRNANSSGAPNVSLSFGGSTDRGVTGDWNGDGSDTVGVMRSGTWYLRNANTAGAPNATFSFGTTGDVPVPGDWDGNGTDTPGLRRSTSFFLRNANSGGPAHASFTLGAAGAAPLAGSWNGRNDDRVGLHDDATFLLAHENVAGGGGVGLIDGNDQPFGRTLQLCTGGANVTWYRGELRAVNDAGALRTVSVLRMEHYLRSVVPRESPASWPAAALQAQAVAARSYAKAENRASYAQTCDSTSCQVYAGRRTLVSGTTTDMEAASSDSAIAATAGDVRVRSGAVMRTEFSSSSGGFTAGGLFPAVADLGDGHPSNPHHSWQRVISAASLEAAYCGSGSYIGASVIARTPEDGNRRAAMVRIVCSNGNVDRTGDQFRLAWALKSTYFDLGGPPAGLSTVGVNRGNVFYLRNSNSSGPSDASFSFGSPSDVPVAGDWDGDGFDTVGVFRGGTWYLRNDNSSGPVDVTVSFGGPGDVPVTGDWNGDGHDSIGIRRGATWYVRNKTTSGPADTSFSFGLATDRPVAGDWDGDRVDSPGVFRTSAKAIYLRNGLDGGPAQITVGTGTIGGAPIAGSWDGDLDHEVGISTDGTFELWRANSTASTRISFTFGTTGDIPITGRWP